MGDGTDTHLPLLVSKRAFRVGPLPAGLKVVYDAVVTFPSLSDPTLYFREEMSITFLCRRVGADGDCPEHGSPVAE